MVTSVFIYLLSMLNIVELVPTYNISVLVQTSVWPELFSSNEIKENDVVSVITDTVVITDKNIVRLASTVCNLVTKQKDGFILFVDCATAKTLVQLSIFRHQLAIVVTKDLCDVTSNTIIQLRPPCFYTNSLLASIAEYKREHNVLLFHDTTLNSICLFDLIRQFSLKSVSTRIVNTEKYNSTYRYLHYLRKHEPDGVFILATGETVTNLFKQGVYHVVYTGTFKCDKGYVRSPASVMENMAELTISIHPKNVYQKLGNECYETMGPSAHTKVIKEKYVGYSWIIVTTATYLQPINGTENHRIIAIRPDSYLSLTSQRNCVDGALQNEGLESYMYLTNALSLTMDIFSQAVIEYNITTLEPINCNQREIPPDRRVIHGIMDSMIQKTHTDSVKYDICSTETNSVQSWKYMGSWSKKKGLLLNEKRLFGNDFVDFGNATLRVAAIPLAPMVFFNIDDNNQTTYSGFCIDILNQLALNYEIISPADNFYGALEDNGTWNGMVGIVMRKEADFAAGPFTITAIRESVIDFTTTFMEEGVGILTLRPKEEANKGFKMFSPMSLTVWISVGVAIVITGILLFITNRYSPFSSDGENNTSTLGMLSSSMWLIYGGFMEQGGDYRPRSGSGRVMISCWWMFTILILSTYTANLAAFLTVTIIESPINSLDQLAAQEEIKPLMFSGSNIYTLFQTSKSDVYGKIGNKMDGMPTVHEYDAALSYVRQGDYAFLIDHSILDYIMLQDCETYAIADEKFNPAGLGFVLQENSSYLEAFNLAIMKMSEAGLLEKWRNKWWPRSDSCTSSDRSSSAQSLDMESLLGLFYIYFAFVGLAMIVFLLELVCKTKAFQKKCSWFSSKFKMGKTNPIEESSGTDLIEM